MLDFLRLFTSSAGEGEGNPSGQDSLEALAEIFKKPTFYIVVGAIILLIILIYIIRRFIKVAPETAAVIQKGGSTKILLSSEKRYFLVPFVEKVVVTLPLYNQETESDQLFINDGPDKLYKITYNISFKVTDAEKFYPFYNNFNKFFENTINEKLRAFSEEKGAEFILKGFSTNKNEIISFLNKEFEVNAIEINEMKIKSIEPVGVRVE